MVCIPRHVLADGERGLGVQPRPQVVGQAIVILKTREVRDASLRHDAVIDSHSVGTADPPDGASPSGVRGS
jgi:hypothetical protein